MQAAMAGAIRMVSAEQVRELLPMKECIDVIRETLRQPSSTVINPLRLIMWLDAEKTNAIAAMPGGVPAMGALGVKVISLFPGNAGTALDAHQGVVLVVDSGTGQFKAVVEAGEVTGIRTAAASGVATAALAREDATSLAIIGSGVQARSHLDAMCVVRDIKTVTVWSRTFANAQAFAARESARTGLPVVACETVKEAVARADIVCGVSGARDPVVQAAWLKEGVHVNAAGACTPSTREFDSETVRKSRFFGDSRESVMSEAGEFLIPLAEDAISEAHFLGEVGDVLRGEVTGRTSPSDTTYFKSLGIAIEDATSANYIVGQAEEKGIGTVVPWV